jgi:Cu2+-exporting ATPase
MDVAAAALTRLETEAEAGCPSGLAPAVIFSSPKVDPTAFVRAEGDGVDTLELLVQGARCSGCIRKIEGALLALPGIKDARLNLSTGRLRVAWMHGDQNARAVAAAVTNLGYSATAFDPACSCVRSRLRPSPR